MYASVLNHPWNRRTTISSINAQTEAEEALGMGVRACALASTFTLQTFHSGYRFCSSQPPSETGMIITTYQQGNPLPGSRSPGDSRSRRPLGFKSHSLRHSCLWPRDTAHAPFSLTSFQTRFNHDRPASSRMVAHRGSVWAGFGFFKEMLHFMPVCTSLILTAAG